jgi:CBS domain-containing protein
MQIREIMTRNPEVCTPDDTLQRAARLMADCDCGAIPVVEGTDRKRVIGVITDRDIAVRAVAKGKTPDTKVNDVMTPSPTCCNEDDDIEVVEQIMVEKQVRRVPVLDGGGRVVGIVAQADLARDNRIVSDREVGRIVEKISEPNIPRRDSKRDVQAEQRL